eukprot:62828_1
MSRRDIVELHKPKHPQNVKGEHVKGHIKNKQEQNDLPYRIICLVWMLYLFKFISKQLRIPIIALTIVSMVQTTNATTCGVSLSAYSPWSLWMDGVYLEAGLLNDTSYYVQGSYYLYYLNSGSDWYVGPTLGSTSVFRYCDGSDLFTCVWYEYVPSVSGWMLDANATVSAWECPITTSDLYTLVLEYKTWDEAEAYCQSTHSTHLATITDDISAQALFDLCPNCNLWMGLNDQAIEGIWEYTDGTECSISG